MKRLNRQSQTGRLRSTWARAGATAVVIALSATLAACSGGTGSSSSTVTIGENADAAPNGYDPMLYGNGQFSFFAGLYDALFVTDSSGKVRPSLVASSSSNADNTQLTLKLRSGVTFSDGSKLTAALVKKNLDRRSDKTLVAYAQIAEGGSSAITDVAAPDSRTVVITWAQPQANGAAALVDETGAIIGDTGVSDPTSLKTTPDGSGAYTLSTGATTRGSTYTLTKNAKAWDAKAWTYDKIVFKVITDVQALANAVVSGQVDIAGQLDPSTIDVVKGRKSLASVGGTIVGFPVADKLGITNKAFAQTDVRLALSYAIDRTSIVKDLHPGAKATAQLFPSAATGFDAALNTKYAYDPAKAKQLLAAAGYPNGFTIDLTVLGKPTDDEVAVQKQWSQIGVTLNFVIATSTDAVFAAVQTQPLLFNSFTVGTNPAGFAAGVYSGFMNLQKATDPDIASALGAALGSTGATRDAALKKLNAAITNDGWYIPIYESYNYFGYDPKKVAKPGIQPDYGAVVLADVKPAS